MTFAFLNYQRRGKILKKYKKISFYQFSSSTAALWRLAIKTEQLEFPKRFISPNWFKGNPANTILTIP